MICRDEEQIHELVPPYSYYLLASIAMFFGFCLILLQYRKNRYLALLWMSVCWFCLGFFYLVNVIGYLLDSPILDIICTYALIPMGFSMILLVDSISREMVDPIKVLLMATASSTTIIYSLPTDAIVPIPLQNGDFGWDWNVNFKFGTIFISVIVGVLMFYTLLKICLHAPPKLRIHSLIALLGTFLLGIMPMIFVATNLNLKFLGIEGIFTGAGAIICSIVISRHPQIMFVLPFEALNLTVISTRTGIPLYSHSWKAGSTTVNDILFSGMIQGISGILNEAVHKGSIQEIRMDEGLLTINHIKEQELAFVLISNKSSKVLRNGLVLFAHKFVDEFRNQLQAPEFVDAFRGASQWISEIFSFIPE